MQQPLPGAAAAAGMTRKVPCTHIAVNNRLLEGVFVSSRAELREVVCQ